LHLEEFSSLRTRPALRRPTIATIGVFDGLHLGHRHFIHHLVERARAEASQSAVVTFWPHPLAILKPDKQVAQLISLEERVDSLHALGVDQVVPMRFNRELAGLEAGEFISVLAEALDVRGMVVGHDFALGRGRAGTADVLAELGQRLGFWVEQLPALAPEGLIISSSAIRTALSRGDVVAARGLLGRSFSIEATALAVAPTGDHAVLEFEVPEPQLLPGSGAYNTTALLDGRAFPSLTRVDQKLRCLKVQLPRMASRFASSLLLRFIRRLEDEGPARTGAGLLLGKAT
jgi:riboflavin kinase/FMN adenylyltransferase